MAVSILESDIDPGSAGVSLASIADGNLVLVGTANRSGDSVIGDGVTETGTGTYVEEGSQDEQMGDGDYRESSAVWSLLASTGEDTSITMAGDGQCAFMVEFDGMGDYDWDNREVVLADQAGDYDSITSPATSSLSGDYLALVVCIVKEEGSAPDWSVDLAVGGVDIDTNFVESGTGTYNHHMVVGFAELSSVSGTITATAGDSGNSADTTTGIYLIVVPAVGGDGTATPSAISPTTAISASYSADGLIVLVEAP